MWTDGDEVIDETVSVTDEAVVVDEVITDAEGDVEEIVVAEVVAEDEA